MLDEDAHETAASACRQQQTWQDSFDLCIIYPMRPGSLVGDQPKLFQGVSGFSCT